MNKRSRIQCISSDYALVLQALRSRAQATRDTSVDIRDAWYIRSYSVLSQALGAKAKVDDLVLATAFAGSWVATIPPACPTTKPTELRRLLRALHAAENGASLKHRNRARGEVLKAGRVAFGMSAKTSVVLLSKALHFLRPELVPMVDANVALAWRWLRRDFQGLQPRSVSGNPVNYLQYWESLWRLKDASGNLNYRDIDVMLFSIGKRAAKKQKKRGKER